jgi:hypothetical protein
MALAVLAMALLPNASLACRARPPDKVVLLDTVPAEAQGSPVIARVVLTEVYQVGDGAGWSETHARARVIEAIKGVEVGRIIQIQSSPWPCHGTLNSQDAGKDGFVAGEFNRDQLLVGFWDLRYARNQPP